MQTAPVQEGEVLAGKYRVERVLGIGGMGVVVAARHLQLDERVALKFLLPGALANSDVVARFAREARAAAKIRSEHVARVTDVGTLENGAPYLVMEYLDGVDLAGVLTGRGALPVEEVTEYVLQACEAVGEAHSIGIVHRDLKPANLFLAKRHDGSPCVKVLDFGISKVQTLSASDMAMTSTQAVMGSPLYMSPEQMFSAKEADQRSDVWALGVILYELLAGVPPFNGDSIAQLAILIAQQEPPPMNGYRQDLPAGLESVVLRCLEKDRGKRFQNVGELAVALAEFAPKRARVSAERVSRMMQAAGMSGTALALPPSSGAEAPPEKAPAITAAAWSETRPDAKPGWGGFRTGVVIAVAALVGGGAWLALRTATASGVSAASSPAAVAAVPVVPPVAPLPAPNAQTAVPVPAPVSSAREVAAPSAIRVGSTGSRGPAQTRSAPVAPAVASAAPTVMPKLAPATPPTPLPAAPPARAKGFDFGGRN